MIIAIKKRSLMYAFFLLMLISLLVLCGAVKEAKDDVEATGAQSPIADKIILVDPGHGGFDAGASANGISEKNINLSVAKRLKACIEECGGTVIMTREEDVSTAGGGERGGSAKASDLKARAAMVKESGADIFVSIHMNKFPQPEYWGAQVFYSDGVDESRDLGEKIQASLLKTLNDGNKRQAKKSDGSIYILKNSAVPSVIVECGFLSNAKEAEKLQNADYQTKLAWGICMGITDYFYERKY